MHTVKIEYRPIPWIPFKKTIRTKHPEAWHELSTIQFVNVVEFLSNPFTVDSQVILINSLLNLKTPLHSFPSEVVNFHDFLKLTDPLNDWVIKKLIIEGKTYWGPSDQFRNVSVGEFAFGDSHFSNFLKTNNQDFLNKMIACYFRPEDPAPNPNRTVKDARLRFNPLQADENSLVFTKLDQRTKEAILFNYKNMRTWIQDQYSLGFPQTSGWRKAF